MPDFRFFDFLVIGNISTEFIIDLHNHPQNSIMGGSSLYAAGGLRCWKNRVAIAGNTNSRNRSTLENLSRRYQVDFEGIHYYADFEDDRIFLGYITPQEVVHDNPVAFYASRKINFPKNLIGYSTFKSDEQSTSGMDLLPQDFPVHYWDITGAIICHTDLKTQLKLSSMLLKTASKILVLQSSDQYMKMANFDVLPILLKDVTTFVTTLDQLSNLFHNRSTDMWEMADYLCGLGCESIVIEDGNFGYFLFDRQSKKRFHAPVYPVEIVDPTGMQESFCGGFLAGIKNNFDSLEGLLQGIVSASFTAEGTGPFYAADAIPALLQSRCEFIHKLVKTI